MQARLWATATALLIFFLVLAGFQGYWQLIAAPWLTSLPYDRTAEMRLKLVQPGSVVTRDGARILGPAKANGSWTYQYEKPEEFAHLLGYDEQSGLRGALSGALLGQGKYEDWRTRLASPVPRGCDVVLTIDSNAQKAAFDVLRGYSGCAVALRTSDAAVLAAASSPSFDPVGLGDSENKTVVTDDPAQPLLFRPVQGLYNPGWGMAWATTAAGLSSRDARVTTGLQCGGRYECDGHRIQCPAVHSKVTLPSALLQGCRIGVVEAAQRLGVKRFRAFVKAAHLLDPAALAVPAVAGRMPDFEDWRGKVNLAEAALGQRETRVTPLAVARFFLSVARGGEVVQPFLVAQVKSPSGNIIEEGKARGLGRCMSARAAGQTRLLMERSARAWIPEGTAEAAPLAFAAWWVPSAEMPMRGEAWIVALSPEPKPNLVLVLVLEDQADEKMAVDLGLSLLHYLQRMAV
jgi:peptidoglycan glycosyltransferase